MLQRISFPNREEWLKFRPGGIGASEAGTIMGDNKSRSKIDLWKVKTGQTKEPDLSDNDYVQRGILWEPVVRAAFAAKHQELKVIHHPYDVLFQSERPWLFCTLDAETYDASGEPGTAEFKTAEPRTREDWAEWDGRVPAKYYDQILHQHLATGWRRHHLMAFLYRMDGDIIIREYEFRVDDGFKLDAQIVLETETLFWEDVQKRRIPPVPIRL